MSYNTKKIIIIGDSSVGKTSILMRFLYNKYDLNTMATLGAGFKSKVITFNDDNGNQ